MSRRPPELVALVEAWRERYETDHRVTPCLVAQACGITRASMRAHAVTHRWCRNPDVVRDAMRAASAKGIAIRHGNKPPSAVPARWHRCAPSSVWQLAAGRATTTARQGGRHVEVSA